jgi:hypothetical protein
LATGSLPDFAGISERSFSPLNALIFISPSGDRCTGSLRDRCDGCTLRDSTHKLVKLFAKGVHPTLTDKRRLALWMDIIERLPQEERALMETIRRDRVIPGIPRAVVDVAFPGMLEERATAYDVPIQAPVPAPAVAPALREMTEAERRYAEVYSKMRFPV